MYITDFVLLLLLYLYISFLISVKFKFYNSLPNYHEKCSFCY